MMTPPNPPAMPDEYYLQNKHAGYLGNAPTWWAKDGKGYTAYILGAHRFSKEEAEKYVNHSPEKFAMFKCADVDARLHLVFDEQDFSRLGTDEPCGWSSGYAALPAAQPVVGQPAPDAAKNVLNENQISRRHRAFDCVIKFLLGEGNLHGYAFGEKPENAGPFWWRTHLRRLYDVVQSNPLQPPPPSAGVDIQPELDFIDHLIEQWDFMKEKWPDEHYRFASVFHDMAKKLRARNLKLTPGDGKDSA